MTCAFCGADFCWLCGRHLSGAPEGEGTPPKKEGMSAKEGQFSRERIVFQPLFFRGHVSFGGSTFIFFFKFGRGLDTLLKISLSSHYFAEF